MRILFVDDEENVLSGLRRMLHCQKGHWDMHFVTSGEAALELFESEPFAVVITDMRMPEMGGAELLQEIRKRDPHTVRMILSGQSDQTASIEADGVAHQVLSKPCDPNALQTAVERACALRNLLSDEVLRDVVARMQTQRFQPAHYIQVMEELREEDVTSLGPHVAKGLALAVRIFSQTLSDPVPGFSCESLWQHSIEVASCAREIANEETKDATLAKHAFLAGLLHDVGQLFLAANLTERYADVLQRARERNSSIAQAERQLLGTTHSAVGGYLLRLWGLSPPVVEAVAFHHTPSRCAVDGFSPLTAVHVANALCSPDGARASQSAGGTRTRDRIDSTYIARLGLEGRLPAWEETCERLQKGTSHGREDSLCR